MLYDDWERIFCENIRALRAARRLSKREMAKVIGVSAATLNRLERGSCPPHLSAGVLLRLSDAFGISTDDLFSDQLKRDLL